MLIFILALIADIILNLIEAKLQSIIFLMEDPKLPNYDNLNNKYHIWFTVYTLSYSIILTLIFVYLGGWHWLLILPVFLASRRLFFQETLNIIRKKGLFYLSDRGLDGKMKKIFGKNAGKINAIICFIIILTCIYLYTL